MIDIAEKLANELSLAGVMTRLQTLCPRYVLVDHWSQGEFHHDVIFRIDDEAFWGHYIVVSTNCNGGVKEVLCFDERPARWALWKWRCPDNREFHGELPPLLAQVRTLHWFNPCELLREDARSELRPEFRRRARGGGWEPTNC